MAVTQTAVSFAMLLTRSSRPDLQAQPVRVGVQVQRMVRAVNVSCLLRDQVDGRIARVLSRRHGRMYQQRHCAVRPRA